jgi:hypothetical protein
MMPNEAESFTWGEFMAWLSGYEQRVYGVEAKLLRIIAYQQLSLSPYIESVDKPYSVEEYYQFPGDTGRRKVEKIDVNELARIWQVKEAQ